MIELEPGLTPVTGTLTLLDPVPMTTLAGTVATLILPEFSVTVSPGEAAGVKRFKVMF